MKKLKIKLFIIIILIILILVVGFKIVYSLNNKEDLNESNTDSNVVFYEKFDEDDFFSTWEKYDSLINSRGNSKSIIEISENGYDDNKALYMKSDALNDIKVHKKVEVEPNTYYKISIMANCKNDPEGYGVILSTMHSSTFYHICDTSQNWLENVIYIKTSDNQNEIDISLGIGRYDGKSTGYAYFDNFKMEKVTEIPQYTNVITFNNEYGGLDVNKPYRWQIKVLIIEIIIVILLLVWRNINERNRN